MSSGMSSPPSVEVVTGSFVVSPSLVEWNECVTLDDDDNSRQTSVSEPVRLHFDTDDECEVESVVPPSLRLPSGGSIELGVYRPPSGPSVQNSNSADQLNDTSQWEKEKQKQQQQPRRSTRKKTQNEGNNSTGDRANGDRDGEISPLVGSGELLVESSGSGAPVAKQETDLPKSYLEYLDALQTAWNDIPDLTITYEGLSYETRVPKESADSIPTLYSSFMDGVKDLNPFRNEHVETTVFHPLHKSTGIVRPGELTLILAPPGHGRSVLLKSLAGRMARDGECFQGEVRWNGLTAAESEAAGQQIGKLCAFVEQGDVHFPMLTVRETFQFALDNSNADSALLSDPDFIARQSQKVELMLELLGLKECADTVVGDTFLRGVSGGQKKRVTLGEMMIGQARALFLDEISTGLDAAATFDIASALKKWTRVMRGSAYVALLQPAPEVFDMFDQLILLRHGHVIFQGSQPALRAHLKECNITPNPNVDFADWLVTFLNDPPTIWKRDLQLAGTQSAMNSFREQEEQATAKDHTPGGSVKSDGLVHPKVSHHTASHVHGEAHIVRVHLKETPEESASYDEYGQEGGASFELQPSPSPSPSPSPPVLAQNEVSGQLTIAQARSGTSAPNVAHKKKTLGRIITSKMVPLSTGALRKRYENSNTYLELQHEIRETKRVLKEKARQAALVTPSDFTRAQFFRQQSRGLWHHTKTCLWRQWVFMVRSTTFVGPRLFQALFMGLVAGSLFHYVGTGLADYTPRMGLIIFSMTFISLINMSEIPLASQFKLVIYKQVDAGFYSTFSYVFSVVVCHFPLAFLEVFIYTTCVYYLSYNGDAAGWWFLVLVLLSLNLFVSVTFRSIAYFMRNADVATNVAGPMTSVTALFAGFLVLSEKIPNWLQWVYWLSPYSWGLRSSGLNEFHSGRYPDPLDESNKNGLGDVYLKNLQITTDQSYMWAGIGYLLGVFVLFIFINGYLLASRRSWLTTGTRRSHDESEEAQLSLGPAHENAGGEIRVRIGEKSTSMRLADEREKAAEEESELEFKRMDLTFTNLRYTVMVTERNNDGQVITYERALLQGINGYAKAGELTALMGSSGAGKTTLMDVISGRKTSGTITGDILVDGHKQIFPHFNRLMGYCEQRDTHMGHLSVRETVAFSAQLRLPTSVSQQVREKFVDQILADLELTQIAHRQVGDENITGLSPGELKRVTIGVELAANPTFLFLDEPTSGLDSRAALIVLRVIRKISRRGRSVICTIHQPSAELFGHFDRLLLLKSGGKEVYFGPVGEEGIDVAKYFLHAPIEEKYYKPHLPPNVNVASWMLDVIGAGTSVKGLIAPYDEVYKSSGLRAQNLEVLKDLVVPAAGSQAITFDTPYASTYQDQFYYVLHRLFTIYWRDCKYQAAKFWILIFMSIVYGLVYLQIDDTDEAGMLSKIGCIYASVGFVSVMQASYSMPFILRMRAVFYRERSSNTYEAFVYSTSLAILEIPYVAACTIVFVTPMYFMIGFNYSASGYFQFNLVMFLTGLYFCYLGQLFSSLSPNMQVSDIFASMCLDLIHLFAGVLIQFSAIPVGWQWFYYMNSMPKGITSILVHQFYCHDSLDSPCPRVFSVQQGNVEVTQWEFIKTYLSTESGFEWYLLGWLVLMIIIVRIMVAATIQWISHVKR